MLRYLNMGERGYHVRPVLRYARECVEFQVVLSGSARPVWEGEEAKPLPAPCLWVHGPGSAHGWTDDRGGVSRIVVFHFRETRSVLTRWLSERGSLGRRLTAEEVELAEGLYEELLPHSRRVTGVSLVVMDKACAELTLMALAGRCGEGGCMEVCPGEGKVEQALAWYREHVGEGPTVGEVARAVFVSPAHLRRLFQQVAGRSPRECFMEIRMSMAVQLLREEAFTVAEVGGRLGFSEPSAFSRAFRAYYKKSPSGLTREEKFRSQTIVRKDSL